MTGDLDFGIYIHVPFCSRKCDYCHFYVIPQRASHQALLLESLQCEWTSRQEDLKGHRIRTLYLGGGTPSLLSVEELNSIFQTLRRTHTIPEDCEITLEVNPETVTLQKLRSIRELGVNRVSLGLQSLDNKQLKLLSRQHTAEKAMDAVLCVYEAGIENISIDLMYELPGQTLASWKETLSQALTLPISHVSVYNLTFEPHTVFFKKRQQLQAFLPSEEDRLKMYESLIEACAAIGLEQYEISAFSKKGAESRHNTGYWQGIPFVGLGPSAFSYWNGVRSRNCSNLHRYAQSLKQNQSPVDHQDDLSKEERERELFVVGLRMVEGVDLHQFTLDSQTLELVDQFTKEGLLFYSKQRLCLTHRGRLVYDSIASELI